MQSTDLFRINQSGAIIAQMSIPVLVSILVMLLYNTTDMYFMGRTGSHS